MVGQDYKDIFVEEAREQIDVLNDRLLKIENDPNNIPVINDIFRTAHTLKSSAAFIGMQDLSDICHKMETLLQKIRDKEVILNANIIDLLFKALDKIRDSVELYAGKDIVNKDFGNLLAELEVYITGDAISSEDKGSKVEQTQETNEENATIKLDNEKWQQAENYLSSGKIIYYVKVVFERDIKMKWVRAELVYVNLERIGDIIAINPKLDEFKTDKLGDFLEAIIATSTDFESEKIKNQLNLDLIQKVHINELTKEKLLPFKDDSSKSDSSKEKIDRRETKATQESDKNEIDEIKDNKSNGGDRRKGDRRSTMAKELSEEVDTKGMLSKSDTVRVTIKKLDELLNLVGELAITNSGFVEISDRFHSMLGNKDIVTEFKGKIDQLSNIAKNLQEGIMQSRMVPIGSVFSRFTRLVRDLSKDLDKNVSISFKGEETELDKKIIDVIGDPLIHLIRNSIDHGLESTEERRKSGKNETGKILLNAYQSGNHIYVEVSDDGQGLNKERILNKAIDKKLVSEDQAQHLSENDIYNIVFLPGFSTKEKVTAVSGRGVGMDVVMDTVKSLNGTVSVRSKRGEGSVFTLSFPLTLAIVPAILTECSFEVYAIPLSNVVETIKVEIKEIQTVDFQEVIRLRNQVIPILRLNDTFEIKSDNSSKRISIVISDFEDQQIGIVVDKLIGKREIVIKTLSQNYKEMRGISGATILGNGQIALILDIPRLIELNRETGQHSRRNIMKKKNFDQIALNRQSGLMDFKVGYDESEIKNKILAEFEMDDYTYKLVKEIFKTALATSSNSIKRFLNKDIILAVPDIEVHQFEKIKNISKFIDEEKMFFSEVDLTEALHGKVIIEMDEAGMMKLFKEFVGNQPIKSSVGESCIMEIGNLITAGITNTISRALGIKTYPSAPSFHYDSHKNYFEKLFDEHHKINNYIWMIDTDIIVDRVVVKGKVYVFPYDRSFKEIGMLVREKKDIFSFMVTA